MRQVFCVWWPYQRRVESMKSRFGYEIQYVGDSGHGRLRKIWGYTKNAVRSVRQWREKRPDVLWLQLPPTPLLVIALLYRMIWRRSTTVVADCHSGLLQRPWARTPRLRELLNRCDCVLVHNEYARQQAQAFGVAADKIVVLEDKPAVATPVAATRLDITQVSKRPSVVVPSSFHADEPIAELLEACRLLPDVTVVITGPPEAARRHVGGRDLPPNVRMAGYLSLPDYETLLATADVVVGLTKEEGVQLSVAGEAVGFGKAMVLAGTEILRTLYYMGAVYVDPLDPEDIARGISSALRDRERLERDTQDLRREREIRWTRQAEEVEARVRAASAGRGCRPVR